MAPRITTTYDRLSGSGARAECGPLDRQGEVIDLDGHDVKSRVSIAEKAAKWLRDHGGTEPSSSRFVLGVWYSWPDYHKDTHSGDEERHSYHLKDFTLAQQRAIYEMV